MDYFNKEEVTKFIIVVCDFLHDLDSSIEYWDSFVNKLDIHYNAVISVRKILKEYKIGEIYKSRIIIQNIIDLLKKIFDVYFKHNTEKTSDEIIDDYLKYQKSLPRVHWKE